MLPVTGCQLLVTRMQSNLLPLFFLNSIKVLVKGVPVFFNVFRRGHAEDLNKLLPKVPGIADTHLESGLVYVHIFGKHQHRRPSQPYGTDKGIQPLPRNGFYLLVQARMAHAHGLREFFHGKFFIVNIGLYYGDAFAQEVLVFGRHFRFFKIVSTRASR